MRARQTPSPPALWLISDARNDAMLEAALARLPRGSGFLFRHHHLPPEARHARYRALARLARRRGHTLVVAGTPALARRWGADGAYGPPDGRIMGDGLYLASVHGLPEIGRANRLGASAVLLSPVFPTRTHPGGATLGPVRFRLLAMRAAMPVFALGGMDTKAARRLRWPHWAAIDGLS